MSDGMIARFTGLSKQDQTNMMRSADAEYSAKYSETASAEDTAPEKVAV
jgi:hypothetical protein